MISHNSLTIDWLNQVSSENRKADKILIEKVIRALLLLEGLVKGELEFVFKGGTALMLLNNSTKRLSIDIDVIISNQTQDLEAIFDQLVPECSFNWYKLQERNTNSNIEKAHYKFYYTPVHQTNIAEDYVLLDILFEEPHYSNIVDQAINSSFLIQDGEPLMVKVPSFEDILGDKLTAFAPETTGIPYEKNGISRAMEIMKQLYDIGGLLTYVEDAETVARTFNIFAKTELNYRNLEPDVALVLNDIYNTALHVSTNGKDGHGKIDQLISGANKVKNYIFSESYHIDRAITDASKAAYISKVIEYGISEFVKFENSSQIAQWTIELPLNTKLNKLKKSNPEAFFYWYQVFIIGKNDKSI
ncbi:nucleotidyl transferase AbiEii/AbiGii toxin family protein [uncultured Mucilaginibacter sp.]|uniref:nucleotidyl transferase AbiEii/AbiGii toxin family protein n=1 Tax=uncultured Mucilaginibacter sp. TaxID=797541 RepID=UPI0026251F52|nr:nucleotidyl transferase AbiEii/AbiGii toxin family protein [uncultured Mucilaginibacter sp.]